MPNNLRYREDEASQQPVVSMEAFLGQTNSAAVRIEPGEDARLLLPHLANITLIEVAFPAFRDGRGYSSARILREAGYKGELRAQGDVLVDQIAYMRRCGFDSFLPNAPLDQKTVDFVLANYAHHYQAAADSAVPVWKLRHG